MKLHDMLLFFPRVYIAEVSTKNRDTCSYLAEPQKSRLDDTHNRCDIFAARYEALLLVTTVASKQNLMTENSSYPVFHQNMGERGITWLFLQRMTNRGRHGLR